MRNLLEYVGNVHIILGPYRGNPISLYLSRNANSCRISPQVYPWNEVVGEGDSPNRAAADFEEKWKAKGLAPEMYTGPHWDGIKPEKPAPPKPAPAPAVAAPKPSAMSGSSVPPNPASGNDPPATQKPPVPTPPDSRQSDGSS